MAHHDTELAIKYLMIAALSTTCKVAVWHTMKELAGKYLTVADLFAHIGLWEDEMTTSVNIIPDTMGQLWTPSLVSRTSPRRSELVVVHQSAEIFPEGYGK